MILPQFSSANLGTPSTAIAARTDSGSSSAKTVVQDGPFAKLLGESVATSRTGLTSISGLTLNSTANTAGTNSTKPEPFASAPDGQSTTLGQQTATAQSETVSILLRLAGLAPALQTQTNDTQTALSPTNQPASNQPGASQTGNLILNATPVKKAGDSPTLIGQVIPPVSNSTAPTSAVATDLTQAAVTPLPNPVDNSQAAAITPAVLVPLAVQHATASAAAPVMPSFEGHPVFTLDIRRAEQESSAAIPESGLIQQSQPGTAKEQTPQNDGPAVQPPPANASSTGYLTPVSTTGPGSATAFNAANLAANTAAVAPSAVSDPTNNPGNTSINIPVGLSSAALENAPIEEKSTQAESAGKEQLPALVDEGATTASVIATAPQLQSTEPRTATEYVHSDQSPAGHSGTPVTDIRLQLDGSANQQVNVRLVQQGDSLRVMVRSNDPALAQNLQDRVPELTSRLEQHHYQTELSLPNRTESGSPTQSNTSSNSQQDLSGRGHGSAGQGNSQSKQQQQRRQTWQDEAFASLLG